MLKRQPAEDSADLPTLLIGELLDYDPQNHVRLQLFD